jgi:hypothetical protein
VLLAVAIGVEELVAVIEQDCLGVSFLHGIAARPLLLGKAEAQLRALVIQGAPLAIREEPFGLLFQQLLFGLLDCHALADSLREGGAVFKGKSLADQLLAAGKPCACTAAGAAMAFIDQHEIVAFEGVYGDRLVAALISRAC